MQKHVQRIQHLGGKNEVKSDRRSSQLQAVCFADKQDKLRGEEHEK